MSIQNFPVASLLKGRVHELKCPFYPLRFDKIGSARKSTVMNDQSGLECRLETAKEDEKDEKVPKRKNASSLADISNPPTPVSRYTGASS